MQALRSTYISAMRGAANFGPLARLGEAPAGAAPQSWRLWAASLLAIYDTERMIRLDLPWWNVAATREIERFLQMRPEARVFEWGSGASTVWLARRARQVISIEHDAQWHRTLAQQTEAHPQVTLLHRNLANEDYTAAIDEFEGDFDLIVVDGRQRAACLERATSRLRQGGLILFDDSGRHRYRAAITGCGLKERRFFGRTYCVPYPDHTSLIGQHG